MGGGDRDADERGVPQRSTLSDEVRGHNGLAVARRQCVDGPQQNRQQDREHAHRDREIVAADERGEGLGRLIHAPGQGSCGRSRS